MRKIKLVIPLLTHPSLNKWTKWHWAEQRDTKEEWDFAIMTALRKETSRAVLVSLIKKASITIKYYFSSDRKRDHDNYTPKFIMDGLVGRVIQDDNDKLVKVEWELLVDRNNPRTTIEIKETK